MLSQILLNFLKTVILNSLIDYISPCHWDSWLASYFCPHGEVTFPGLFPMLTDTCPRLLMLDVYSSLPFLALLYSSYFIDTTRLVSYVSKHCKYFIKGGVLGPDFLQVLLWKKVDAVPLSPGRLSRLCGEAGQSPKSAIYLSDPDG